MSPPSGQVFNAEIRYFKILIQILEAIFALKFVSRNSVHL